MTGGGGAGITGGVAGKGSAGNDTHNFVIPARDAKILEFYQVDEHKNSRFTLKYNINHYGKTGFQIQDLALPESFSNCKKHFEVRKNNVEIFG